MSQGLFRHSCWSSEVPRWPWSKVNSRLLAAVRNRHGLHWTRPYCAPFATAIKERLVGEGELAAPGQPIVTLVEFGENELRAGIANHEIAELKSAKATDPRLPSRSASRSVVTITSNCVLPPMS
jgi:hypothetical protein